MMVAYEPIDRTHWQNHVAQAGKVLAAALVIYAAGVVVLMGAIFATGGGVSCDDADCVPLARVANDLAPWGMILWIVVSLVIATVLVRHWTHSRSQGDS